MSVMVAVAQVLRALEHQEFALDIPCHWPGPLSLEESRRVMRAHRECGDGLALCRVRRTAARELVEAGVIVPDSHRPDRQLGS